MNELLNKGTFIISLDFELAWGIIEKDSLNTYCKTNICNVGQVVHRMLDLFEKYNVKATFATVGFLMCHNKEEIKKYIPHKTPSYKEKTLSPYSGFLDSITDESPLYFAPSIIEKLKSNDNIEIGTHTFCHYYCLEEGQTVEEFEDDIISATKLANDNGIEIQSIVFPRNNINSDYLRVCFRHGIICYRGNANKFYGKVKNRVKLIRNRLGRLIDSYLPLNSGSCYKYSCLLPKEGCPINVPASRFFRPYNKKLSLIEPLRIIRIQREIKHAAKVGELYHLWWHPHNFGANINKNLDNLEKVLKYYSKCREKYGMQSLTMSDVAKMIKSDE